MLQRDYLLLMVEQLAAFLRRVAHLRSQGETDVAIAEIEEFARQQFGLRLDDLAGMSVDLLDRIASGEHDRERWIVLARLLDEMGEMLLEREEHQRSARLFRSSLLLHLELCAPEGVLLLPEFEPQLERLIERTAAYDLPQELQRRVILYLESSGRFDRAEDMLTRGTPNRGDHR